MAASAGSDRCHPQESISSCLLLQPLPTRSGPFSDVDRESIPCRLLVADLAAPAAAAQPAIREKLGVKLETAMMGGVKVYILTPKEISPANRNRLLIHVHGGGYIYNPGEAGTQEGTL